MPATFPSHQGAVLPLKLWRPQWFDGVALAIGAAAPDVAYTLDGSGLPVWPLSHQQRGLVLWCLPVTLALAWVVRRAAAVVAAHLPQVLSDYGALRVTRHRWWVTWSSAMIGAESHLVLDRMGQSRAVEWTLDAMGAVVTALVAVHIGRLGLLRVWHGPAPEIRRRPTRFWGTAAVVAVAGLAALPFLPGAWLVHTTGTRVLAWPRWPCSSRRPRRGTGLVLLGEHGPQREHDEGHHQHQDRQGQDHAEDCSRPNLRRDMARSRIGA